MKAYSEAGDLILRTLTTSSSLSWDKFTQVTELTHNDPIFNILKNKGLIECSKSYISLTNKGREFITTTSFVEQRHKQQTA